MPTSDNVSVNRIPGSGGSSPDSLEQALAEALQRSLPSIMGGTVPVSPELLRPLGLLPRHVLLVGDDEIRQQSALDLLARWEIPAEIATNCADAVEFAADGEFDLIIIDASRSVLDCVFVSSRLRNLERSRNPLTPAALVARVSSEWSSAERVLRMVGVNDVLKAQSEDEAVGECLRRWCSGQYKSIAGQTV